MRLLKCFALAAPLLFNAALVAPVSANATGGAGRQFHEAFLRMDAAWPNISAHDYWLALRDAEDAAKRLSLDDKAHDPQVSRDLHVFGVYKNCWLALQAKEKAMSELLVGQLILQDTPENSDAAREHFALAVASWDEAFRLWPFLMREKVKGDALSPRGEVEKNGLVGSGSAWRATAQRQLDQVTAVTAK